MDLAIVTGASRGLGRAIVTSCLQRDVQVLGIARGFIENSDCYKHIQADLSDLEQVSTVVEHLIKNIRETKPSKLHLFHNASIIEPIGRIGRLSSEYITKAFHVNTLAPMIITNELIKQLADLNIQLVIINITSGAAERPISGWSVYSD